MVVGFWEIRRGAKPNKLGGRKWAILSFFVLYFVWNVG